MADAQRAGKNSTQLSAGRDVIIIDNSQSESDIRSIVRSEMELTLSNFKADAIEKYIDKGNSMIDKLISVIGTSQEKLNVFSDPDFNFAVRDASRAVASNDSDFTEELLVDILANRVNHGSSNKVKLVTKLAIEAADKLTETTLNNLANFWVMLYLVPNKSSFEAEFTSFSLIYGESFATLSPTKPSDWIEEAELLRLVEVERGFNSDSTKSFAEMLGERMLRYLRAGIPANRWKELNKLLEENEHGVKIDSITHPLKDGFVLLDYDSKDDFFAATQAAVEGKELINEMASLNKFDDIDKDAQLKLDKLINENDNLKKASVWWDQLPACRMTTIGKSIGYLHARKYITFAGADNLEDYLNK